jgi:hypothetical protein
MKFNLKSFRLGDFLSKRINTILLIVILIIILTGHVVCSCSRIPASKVVEKLTNLGSAMGPKGPAMGPKGPAMGPKGPAMGQQAKVDMLKKVVKNKLTNAVQNRKEGFTGANTNYGQSAPYLLGSPSGTVAVDTNSWNQPDLVVKCDGSYGKGVADILGRPKQPIPLQEGELDIFATTPFKPECCPNFYSNSTGCACMTTDQYNYVVTRGGNNVPYSEY